MSRKAGCVGATLQAHSKMHHSTVENCNRGDNARTRDLLPSGHRLIMTDG
jgi:hypothetical protein